MEDKKTIKIALFSGYGGDILNSDVISKLGNVDTWYSTDSRIRIAEIIGELPDTLVFSTQKDFDTFVKKSQSYYKAWDLYNEISIVYFTNGIVPTQPGEVTVVEVDISRKWKIEKHSGAEVLVYLEPEILEEKYNRCK